MADYRIVLAQLPTPRAAEQAAQTLAAAFARHVDAIKKTRRYRGELTEPLHALARDEGFAWAAEDRFAWDDSDDDPNFVIGSAGHLLVAYHAAAMQLAEVGLQAFARARGANATTFWDPDPTPGTLTIKVAKAAGFAEALARACEDNDVELELSDAAPAAGTPRLAIVTGKRTRHAHLGSSWGIGGLLLDLGRREGVDLTLDVDLPEVPAPMPGALDPVLDRQIAGAVKLVVVGARRGVLPGSRADEAFARAFVLTGGRYTREAIELGLATEPLPPAVQREVAAQATHARKLAASAPLTQRELAMTATAHTQWLKTASPPHRWRALDVAGVPVAIYDGPTIRHASFALRDARALTFAERPLVAASFAGALLDGANFTKADASHASFAHASALGTAFAGATLVGADFTSADLRGASFRDADVRDAIWTGAELAGADFTGARR